MRRASPSSGASRGPKEATSHATTSSPPRSGARCDGTALASPGAYHTVVSGRVLLRLARRDLSCGLVPGGGRSRGPRASSLEGCSTRRERAVGPCSGELCRCTGSRVREVTATRGSGVAPTPINSLPLALSNPLNSASHQLCTAACQEVGFHPLSFSSHSTRQPTRSRAPLHLKAIPALTSTLRSTRGTRSPLPVCLAAALQARRQSDQPCRLDLPHSRRSARRPHLVRAVRAPHVLQGHRQPCHPECRAQ